MGVVLEIRDGPMAGKVIGLKMGESITVGRAAGRAEFALPHDTFMSGVHFALECGPSGCRVQDRKSSNGTFLNGARIQAAMLANGDEIKSGQTIFTVRIVADAKLASLIPTQDSGSPAASRQRPPAAEPAPSPSPERRPRAAEPAPPPLPQVRPRDAEAAPPAAPVPERLAEQPRPAPLKAEPVASPPAAAREDQPPAGPSASEPPSPVMRAADLDDAADLRPTRDAGAGPAAPRFSGSPETPVKGAQPPASSGQPPVEEPPRFHAIPSPPSVKGQALRGGQTPAEVGANARRSGEPPPGVAPYMAEKFAERLGARGGAGQRGAAFSVMGWSFPAAPAEWQVQEGFGLQQSGHEEFPSSVAATEELLGGITLQQFVESQISTLRGYLRDPKIEPTMPPRVGGADESMAVDVRHSTKDGRELVYRRIYARSGSSVGVLTVTTLAAELPQVLLSLQPLLEGAAFRSTVSN